MCFSHSRRAIQEEGIEGLRIWIFRHGTRHIHRSTIADTLAIAIESIGFDQVRIEVGGLRHRRQLRYGLVHGRSCSRAFRRKHRHLSRAIIIPEHIGKHPLHTRHGSPHLHHGITQLHPHRLKHRVAKSRSRHLQHQYLLILMATLHVIHKHRVDVCGNGRLQDLQSREPFL